jgi:hypothetical protein
MMYECPICHKTFLAMEEFQHHMASHIWEKITSETEQEKKVVERSGKINLLNIQAATAAHLASISLSGKNVSSEEVWKTYRFFWDNLRQLLGLEMEELANQIEKYLKDKYGGG